MTALERYEDRAPATQDVAVARLGEWAQSAQAAYAVAEQLVKTSFVPEGFRGKPYEATAAILAGLELGLQPMSALRSFDVISGQAAPRAITLRAVVQAHGHEMVLEESTATSCKMRGRRAGSSEWQTVRWTLDRAKALGVTGKNNWKTQPQAMLVARATSELARLIAADAILGIAYSAEELVDGVTVDQPPTVDTATGEVVQATAGTKRMTRRKPTAEGGIVEPFVTAELDEPETVTPLAPNDMGPAALSDAQMKKLRALYGDINVKSAADQKQVTAHILGVDRIDTHSTLTPDQASTVIDRLDAIHNGYLTLEFDDDGAFHIVDAAPTPEDDDS